MNNLVEAIKQKQGQAELTDGALSKLLGIDRSTWSYIKSGKRNPGMKFLSSVASIFPELKPLVDAEIYDSSTPITTNAHQPHQDKRGGVFLKLLRKGYLGIRSLFVKNSPSQK